MKLLQLVKGRELLFFAFKSFIIWLSFLPVIQAQAPDSWEQKSDIGFNVPNGPKARSSAVGFSIGDKGYVGTGYDTVNKNDFWEYDPGTGSWTQKANFAGTVRRGAVGFSIGNKGYIGTGYENYDEQKKDFWEYDPGTNVWARKADFAGGGRANAIGFSIGNKGYVGMGMINFNIKNDFWEYDPTTDTWIQKANFGGLGRNEAVGFSIGNKGYIGTGDNTNGYLNDFWEYHPDTNTWVKKADFGGTARAGAVGFSIGNKGYIGTGFNNNNFKSDFWEYDPVINTWTQKNNFSIERMNAIGFSIGTKGYIGLGLNSQYNSLNDFGEYDQNRNIWTKKSYFGSHLRVEGVGFSIGSKGYIGTGYDTNGYLSDFWEYDPDTDSWTQKANFGGTARISAVGFSIANKGYIGTGHDGHSIRSDFWEYDPGNNTWIQKADFGGGPRNSALGFSIGNKGYIGIGYETYNDLKNDFWEYNPDTNTWTQKAGFRGRARVRAVGFSIGSKGYIGTGYDGNYTEYSDFWEYNPDNDSWTKKADFGARRGAIGFSIGNKGYIGTGSEGYGNLKNDFWEYNPITDNWRKNANFGGSPRTGALGFSIGGKGYIGTNNELSYGLGDFWAYTPNCTDAPTATVSGGGMVCPDSLLPNVSITLIGSPPWNLTYFNGSDSITITNINSSPYVIVKAPIGNYTVTALSDANCSHSTYFKGEAKVRFKPLPTALLIPPGTLCLGSPLSNLLIKLTGTPPWSLTYSNGTISTTVNNIYSGPYIIPNANKETIYTVTALKDNNCLGIPSSSIVGAPVITADKEEVCIGTQVTLSTNCPVGSNVLWNDNTIRPTISYAFTNSSRQYYRAQCLYTDNCLSDASEFKTIAWRVFNLTLINIGKPKSAIKEGGTVIKADWSSQFITPDGGPTLGSGSYINPTLYYTEKSNKVAPRYWTIQVETCLLGTEGSVSYDMLATPEVGTVRSYNTHENNAPYFMFANRDGFTELYAQNHPAYGFYQNDGNGGNTYDEGFPKGLYKLGIRYWNQKGQGSIYPSTRQPVGKVVAYEEYWFRIQSQNGIGTGAGRVAVELTTRTLAEISPNPVTRVLKLKISEAKGQTISAGLMDASGRTLLQRTCIPETQQHQEELDVSQLANGMYFLQVKTSNFQTTLKVVKVQ